MSNHNGGPVIHDVVEGYLNLSLRGLIQCRCSLIKDQDLRAPNDGSGYSDPLFLTPRELAALDPALDVKPMVELEGLFLGASPVDIALDSSEHALLLFFVLKLLQDICRLSKFLAFHFIPKKGAILTELRVKGCSRIIKSVLYGGRLNELKTICNFRGLIDLLVARI